MPITPKQNWRYPGERWKALAAKLDRLGIDRSTYLTAMCELALAETDRQTAKRLELTAADVHDVRWRGKR